MTGGDVGKRRLLRAAAASAVLLAGSVARAGVASRDPTGLAAIAARHGRFYGAETATAELAADAGLARAFAAECGVLVPGWEAKWSTIHPEPNRYDFRRVDTLIAFAESNGMLFRGHCAVWHRAIPDWLPAALRSGDPRAILQGHIATVLGRYRGRVQSWDVVNEAVAADGPGRLRKTLWLDALGPDYLDIAFRAARQADPYAALVYNDYGTENADHASDAKRAAVLDLLRGMRARGVPVDALGMQAHLAAGGPAFDPARLRGFIRDVASLGLRVYVTELDVNDDALPADEAVRDGSVAELAGAYLDAALAEPAVEGVITWGLSDRYSWLNADYRRRDGMMTRGLPLDPQMRRTPLWNAMAGALAT